MGSQVRWGPGGGGASQLASPGSVPKLGRYEEIPRDPRRTGGTMIDAIELLTQQHSEVDELFEKFEKASEGQDERVLMELFTRIADNLAAHATIEEKLFYPSVYVGPTAEKLQHAVEEHLSAKRVLADGRTVVLSGPDVECDDPDCPIRTAVVAPVISDDTVVGGLAAYGRNTSAGLVRATDEVARWVSSQVELAELDRERTRAIEAELRALRAHRHRGLRPDRPRPGARAAAGVRRLHPLRLPPRR